MEGAKLEPEMRDGFDAETNSIYVPADWNARTGITLVPGLQLGKMLGQGMQGQIFELLDNNGTIAPIVLKASKRGALISDLEREWDAGQRVSSLAGRDGNLPGFMKVGPALRIPDGKIVGQILERINGKSVSAVISQKDWSDIRYLRDMLLTVLTALDRAQRSFGFHHCDFRLENVMEHTPDPAQLASDPISLAVLGDPKNRDFKRTFKTIDYGLAKFDDWYSAAHGWLQQEAKGNEVEMDVAKRLAVAEWIHRTAWKGKGDVYHIIFDTIQFVYGKSFPTENSTLVTLLNMTFVHICGVMPKLFIESSDSDMADADRGEYNVFTSRVGSTKYAAPEEAESIFGKVTQRYYRWSRIHRWGRKCALRDSDTIMIIDGCDHNRLKAWNVPKNPGVSAGEILTSPFFSRFAVMDAASFQPSA